VDEAVIKLGAPPVAGSSQRFYEMLTLQELASSKRPALPDAVAREAAAAAEEWLRNIECQQAEPDLKQWEEFLKIHERAQAFILCFLAGFPWLQRTRDGRFLNAGLNDDNVQDLRLVFAKRVEALVAKQAEVQYIGKGYRSVARNLASIARVLTMDAASLGFSGLPKKALKVETQHDHCAPGASDPLPYGHNARWSSRGQEGGWWRSDEASPYQAGWHWSAQADAKQSAEWTHPGSGSGSGTRDWGSSSGGCDRWSQPPREDWSWNKSGWQAREEQPSAKTTAWSNRAPVDKSQKKGPTVFQCAQALAKALVAVEENEERDNR